MTEAGVKTELIADEASSGLESSFNWLSREARGSAYVSYSEFSHKPACSFDFGEDGYAASCNYGGKILHMSAKSEQSGILFAQGNFDSTLYSSLARAQRTYGGQSTFGLELPVSPEPFNLLKRTGSALRLGEMVERGSFNHRWPFNEYALISNFGLSEDDVSESDIELQIDSEGGSIGGSQIRPWVSQKEVGTCVSLSFVKNGILYQILRLEASCICDPDESYMFPFFGRVVLEVGGLLKFQDFERSSPMHASSHKRKTAVPDCQVGLPHRISTTGGVSLLDYRDEPSMELDIRVHRLASNVDVAGSSTELQLHYTSEKGTCYFETQGDLTHDKFKRRNNSNGRTVTFMASFRLRDKTDLSGWPDIPTSEEIYEHIGAASSDPFASAAMWENIFARRKGPTGLTTGFPEDLLVARCLEKILHVDLVPASFSWDAKRPCPTVEPSLKDLPGSARGKLESDFVKRVNTSLEDRLRSTPLALVSNLFLQPKVDLEAMFWKTRFLVKAYEFLLNFAVPQVNVDANIERLPTKKPFSRVTTRSRDICDSLDFLLASEDLSCMKYAAYCQSQIIKNRIELVVEYLIHTLLQPNPDTLLLPDKMLAFEPNYYYAMITLCYVSKKTKHFNFTWPSVEKMAYWGKTDSMLFARLPANNDNFNPVHKEKVLLLKWYHYGSVRELVKGKLIPSSWMDGVANNAVYRLKGDAIRAAKAKISSRAGYVADDEILDRLSFLAWPLGLEDRESSDFCPATMASITANRIRDRDFTREINPGFMHSSDSGSTCGPWEVHALCHHSRLMVAIHELQRRDGGSVDGREDEVDRYRQKLGDFITAECSVVPSWERPSLTTHQGLLRSEATSVVGATLLAIFPNDFAFVQEKRDFHASGDVAPGGMFNPWRDTQYNLYQLRDDGSSPAIDWMQFRLPNRYHPENFFNSLEGTPRCYRYDLLGKMEIPTNLCLYLSQDGVRGKGDIVAALETLIGPRFSSESVLAAISSTSISMIDLAAPRSERLDYMRRRASHNYRICTAGMARLHATEIWGKTLQGPLLPGGVFYDPPGDEEKKHEYVRVTRRISNSLVDQEVQHRILQVSRLSGNYHMTCTNYLANRAVGSSRDKSLVAHFIYVFHPESADAFNDNVFKTSRFVCKNRGMWATHITLRSWRFTRTRWSFPGRPCEVKQSYHGPTLAQRECSVEEESIELPPHLHETFGVFQPDAHDNEDASPSMLSVDASSIALSTNEFGDFSKLSIISKLITEAELKQVEEEVPILWQLFIHQPQTSRCLVFLLILGVLCERIAANHQSAIAFLASIKGIEGSKTWIESPHALQGLEIARWKLDSLQRLQNTLAGTLVTMREARASLSAQIKKGPGKRSPALEIQCQQSIEAFDRRLGLLIAHHINIDRETEQSGRYVELVPTMLSLNDSRRSLQQNVTIQILTFVTIAYLPVALTAAIFAIPAEQNVLLPAMGRKWFLLSIFILFVFTITAAILMGTLLSFLGKVRKVFRRVWDFGSSLLLNMIIPMPRFSKRARPKTSYPPWMPEKNVTSHLKPQSEGLEGLNPVESLTRSSLGRILTPSLTRRNSHVDDPRPQSEGLEGLNPVGSSTRTPLGRILTPSLARRNSHLDDPRSQSEGLEGFIPVGSSTKTPLGRILTSSLTWRNSHPDDPEA